VPASDYFSVARRQLRRARVEDALGLDRTVASGRHRDRLLERLAEAADAPLLDQAEATDEQVAADFGTLAEDVVDMTVSLALAELDEADADALTVTLMCVQVLALDGQFARLAQLSSRLRTLAERFEVERPFLSLAVAAFAATLEGRRGEPARRLRAALGDGTTKPERKPRTPRNVDDLLVAASLRSWLSDGELRPIRASRRYALRRGHGLLLIALDAVLAYALAASAADTRRALRAADDTFGLPALAGYLDRLSRPTLFPAQQRAIEAGATRDQTLVVSLPTSSGKTFIAELRIVASLSRRPGSRAVYVAPYRLLARQVEREFRPGLTRLGLTVQDLGSGYDPTLSLDGGRVGLQPGRQDAGGLPDVAVCTPERLDALLRLSTENGSEGHAARKLLDSLSVLVFDELHLVGRSGRGPRFELLIARLRWTYPQLPILGLCAASHGVDDLAQWLGEAPAVTGGRRPTGTLELAWETDGRLIQRAGTHRSRVAEIPRGNQPIADAASLVLRFRADMQPVLVIETTRPQAESVAKRVHQLAPAEASRWRDGLLPEDRRRVDEAVAETRLLLGADHPLADLLGAGLAYHHAGIPTHVLMHIEGLAATRCLRVLCATTTVAEGADLPFRVVVIPHLNFAGGSRRLERDLYLNIIGRAGRANVAMEGLVIVLDSKAPTLNNVIRASLWADTQADRVQGRLKDVSTEISSTEDLNAYQDVQSQVLAWLDEGGGGLPDQAQRLGGRTLSHVSGGRRDRRAVQTLLEDALEDLEDRGLAIAASPLRLTRLGRRVRLGGLSAPSAVRLNDAVALQRNGWLADLPGTTQLSRKQCEAVAALALETTEVLEHSLWLRRTHTTESGRALALFELGSGRRRWPSDDELFEADVQLLALWIGGADYREIAQAAPRGRSANSLFGGADGAKLISDAAEYVGRISYPAAWAWSAARVLMGQPGDALPPFVRQAVEFGAPTETASRLIAMAGVTRLGARLLAEAVGSDWQTAAEELGEFDADDLLAAGLSSLDADRVARYLERTSER